MAKGSQRKARRKQHQNMTPNNEEEKIEFERENESPNKEDASNDTEQGQRTSTEDETAEITDTEQQNNLRVDTQSTGGDKHKNNERSPASQDVGSQRKRTNTENTFKGTKVSTTISFKKVNATSHNRRQCNRVADEAAASTPERNNRWNHRFKTRITFKMKVPSVENPLSAIQSIMQEFIQELRRIDSSAALLPWRSGDSHLTRITKASEIPTSTPKLRKYLKKFYVGQANKEITIYPGIHLGHNTEFTEIRERMQDWLDDGNHAMFYMMLQAEDSSEIGWLLYTTREMDAGAMADEITDLVGVKVGLRWKVIDIGVKGKIPASQKVNALIVEVETKYRWESQQKMTNYFGRDRKDSSEYPNGVRVRFVKHRKDALNAREQGKLDRLRARQQMFLSKIVSHESWDILQLDYNPGPEGSPTLRQMIMGLTVGTDDSPLFHSVDLDWKGVGYVYQFSPELKAIAECTIHTLLPLLQHHFPECNLEGNFTQEAITRCRGMVYDEATGTVIDPTLEQSMKYMEEAPLRGFELDMSLVEQQETELGRPLRTGFPTDVDSVSTLGRPNTQTAAATTVLVPRTTVGNSTGTQHDDALVMSSTSGVTMATIQTIETQIQSLQQQAIRTDAKFNEIISLLRQGNGISQRTELQDGTPSNPVTLEAGSSTSAPGGVP